MALKVEWHPAAIEDLARINTADQRRIQKTLQALKVLDDARQRLVPYTGSLKGFWKLCVGDYRLVCQIIERHGQIVLIIHVAHRSTAYGPRSIRAVKGREE